MVASSLVSAIALLSGLALGTAAKFPRQITESALDPWVSVNASGFPVTVTPILTTINGVETTLSAAPASLTATTTSTRAESLSTTNLGGPAAAATGGGSFLQCHNINGPFAPFCTPNNGSSVYVGETYYVEDACPSVIGTVFSSDPLGVVLTFAVTWDTSFFTEENATIQILVNYVNASGGGLQAYHSDFTANNRGFISWTIDSSWLKGQSFQNVTLIIVPWNPTTSEPVSAIGPVVMITNSPAPEPYRQPMTKAPKGASLYIALPTVFAFVLICVCGGFILNRRHRKIGLGNIMGRRKGYGVGKSRSQRLELTKKNPGAIELRVQELSSDGQYRDAPEDRDRRNGRDRADSDALGSLASSPTEERTNYFRDEIRR